MGKPLRCGTLKVRTCMVRTLVRRSLTGLTFNRSIISDTKFSNVYLGDALKLDNAKHTGPSSIGIDTIYKSQGQIPEVFLRGCGVPENFIRYMKSFTINPIEYYSCFISYSHQDKFFAKRLHDQLQAQGIRCWLDDHQILPGDDIYEQVDRVLGCGTRSFSAAHSIPFHLGGWTMRWRLPSARNSS